MKNELQFNNYEETMRDYRISGITQKNDDYMKAIKNRNTEYFYSVDCTFLFCLIYKNSTATENSAFLQSPGILCFCEDCIIFSNKSGLNYTRGRIEYTEVEQFAIITKLSAGRAVAGLMGFDSSGICFFLKDKQKLTFAIRNSDGAYALSKLSELCNNYIFPFYPINIANNTFYFNHR